MSTPNKLGMLSSIFTKVCSLSDKKSNNKMQKKIRILEPVTSDLFNTSDEARYLQNERVTPIFKTGKIR